MRRAFLTVVLAGSLAALAYAGAIRGFRCADDKYPCPECKNPFAAVTRMDYCPTCGQKTISETDDGKWD